MYNINKAIQNLLAVIGDVAPNDDVKRGFVTLYQTACAETVNPSNSKEIFILLLNNLSDGIKYGNWPNRDGIRD